MEAFLFESLKDNKVKCNLCNHRCILKDGSRGICGVRENRSGILFSLIYEKIIARHIDPIEKKPLYHLAPGSLSYSIATVGCNFKCQFCQNADIAQMPSDRDGFITGDMYNPEEIVEDALNADCRSIAYTYTEPTVYFELAFNTAKLAHERGIKNVFVTNGYMTSEAIKMISPYLDAANVDLKAFSDEFYQTYCKARLEPVKETLKQMKSLGILVEVTTLLIPGLNDDPKELEALAYFIANDLGTETPWHISRFHPTYKLTDRPPTPVSSLLMARDIGKNSGLRYVYTGNVPGEMSENTFCYSCEKVLIERFGFHIRKNKIKNNKCPFCNTVIDGIQMSGSG